ncbi:MAG: TonB-dependent receptor [Amphiplicatus sp.]
MTALAGAASADEGIIVTAERRAQSSRELPASAVLIDESALRLITAGHASEILNRASGVLIHRGNGQEHLTAIRSPVLTGGAGAGSFLFLENGVPLRSAGFANVNALFEAHTEIADRVEIIKGPSGALYGANAIHGVVNVFTPTPDEDFAAGFSFSGDTVERFKGTAFTSATRRRHGFYAGVSGLSEAGFRDESGVDQQKATLRHDYAGDAVSTKTIFSAVNLNQETAGFVIGDDAYLDPVLRRTNPNPEAYRDARAARLSSEITVEAGEGLVFSVTPFARWNEMEFLMHFVPSQAREENGHWSVGAQTAVYAAPSPRISLIAGIDWEYTNGYLREEQFIPTVFSYTQGLHYDFDVAATSVSGFLQGRYKLTRKLTAMVAARADWTRYAYDNNTDDGVVGRFLRPADRSDRFLTVSPKASLLYELGAGSAYASYARGARPPQTTDLYRLQVNQTADPAESETIDSFEVGWKGALGPRVDFDVAVYFMDKRRFFFRDADGYNVNDGKTRHVGVEADLAVRPSDKLTLSANASYGRHTYRFSRPILSLPNATEAIAFGDEVDTAPAWLAGARALWTPVKPLSLEAEWSFVGAYFTDAANSQTYPGHNLVNLRAAFALNERWTVSATVRNLLDAYYAERADFAFGEERYFPGEERTFGIGIRGTL